MEQTKRRYECVRNRIKDIDRQKTDRQVGRQMGRNTDTERESNRHANSREKRGQELMSSAPPSFRFWMQDAMDKTAGRATVTTTTTTTISSSSASRSRTVLMADAPAAALSQQKAYEVIRPYPWPNEGRREGRKEGISLVTRWHITLYLVARASGTQLWWCV